MFLSMNWIGDFVDLSGLDRKALIHRFTLSCAEVEDVYVKGEDTYGVVVAKILSVEAHPNSKKLHLLKVDTGAGVVDVVCGAPNVREGMKVAFVKEGGAVQGQKITAATVGGYMSYGMCCAENELGISDDHSGLMEIFDDAPLGTDIKELYPIDDIIFEVDNKSLTNRPDLWGHYGIAREFATITGRPMKALDLVNAEQFANLPAVAVDVRATDLVWRYTALKVANVTRKVSPVWMRIRLYYCGSRAINFLADLTNYVMMELGQPMHAFDNAKVDKIEVQTFDKPFVFETLDGVKRNIDDKMLMITSGDVPVAIAGIMGGEASKIEDTTNSLLLESATFDGVSVRKTTTRLGHRTDASMRYEKMLDPELCRTATERLLSLLFACDKGAKVTSSFTDVYVKKYPTVTLKFDRKYVDRYTGIFISDDTVEKTLTSLGFALTKNGDEYTAVVPSWRATKDVTIKADVIEEITRIYGYDNFEIDTAKSALRPVLKEVKKSNEDRIKDLLVEGYRLHEVHSYIWSDIARNNELGIKTPENVKIINAQTPDHRFLRVSMIPTLLSFAADNRAYADEFGLFEIGHTVEGLKPNGYCNEYKKLGMVFFSKKQNEEAVFGKAVDAVLEIVGNLLHKSADFARAKEVPDYAHPANCFDIKVDGKVLGTLSVPHPTVLENIDKKAAVAFAEINTDLLAAVAKEQTKYREPSKFPAIDIDLTFAADIEAIDFVAVKEKAFALSGDLLAAVKVQDTFVEGGRSTVTLRFSFLSKEKTLTKNELAPAIEALTKGLSDLGLAYV